MIYKYSVKEKTYPIESESGLITVFMIKRIIRLSGSLFPIGLVTLSSDSHTIFYCFGDRDFGEVNYFSVSERQRTIKGKSILQILKIVCQELLKLENCNSIILSKDGSCWFTIYK